MFWKNRNEEKLNKNTNGDMAKQVFAFFLGIAMTILYFTDFGTSNLISKKSYAQYQQMEKIVNTIENNYYEEVEREYIYESMKYGALMFLQDNYSYYLGPMDYQAYIKSGQGLFYGYGLQNMEYLEDMIIVGQIMNNSPAKSAGMLDGDKIVEINGKTISEQGIDKVKEILLDNNNKVVDLGIKRENVEEIIYFKLEKNEVQETSVNSKMMGDVGYIHLSQFISKTGMDFEKAVDELLGAGAKCFVIDLRNNGGGLFDEAIKVADRILPEATITYTQTRKGEEVYFKTVDKKSIDLPIAILVNEKSASASELVAAALQDNGAGQIYGTTTFGKGIVQETYRLRNDSGFKLTTKKYLSPNGHVIHKIGVKPDIVIAQDVKVKLMANDDIQLQKALKDLREQL